MSKKDKTTSIFLAYRILIFLPIVLDFLSKNIINCILFNLLPVLKNFTCNAFYFDPMFFFVFSRFDVIECGDVEKLIKKKDNQLQIIYYTMPVQKRCTIL